MAAHSHSVNTIPSIRDYIISEDLLAGQRLNGRMSNVRRFFCLFVTFDCLFISLMWLICVMLIGENIVKALSEQILHYDIRSSLFDIVLVAFCRFLLLIIFYAILYINHWIIISLSTASSCAFLIGKVFMYDWPKSSQPVFEVLLVLASFILSWGEAWFLDFRVIPQETHANRYLITVSEPERAPLLRSFFQGLPSTYTESNGNFYSPLTTPDGSIYRGGHQPSIGEYHPVRLTGEQEENYKCLGAKTVQAAWDLYQNSDWILERQQNQDYIFSRKDPKLGKTFKLVAEISTTPKFLLDELYYNVGELPKWSKAIKESYKIQTIDEKTDICYHISQEAAGGLVSSRDFINIRQWTQIEDTYIIASYKCDHPRLPLNSKYVRGENGVCGYVMQPIQEDQDKVRLTWIINTNIHMPLPKFVLEKELISMMFLFIQELRVHISRKSDVKLD